MIAKPPTDEYDLPVLVFERMFTRKVAFIKTANCRNGPRTWSNRADGLQTATLAIWLKVCPLVSPVVRQWNSIRVLSSADNRLAKLCSFQTLLPQQKYLTLSLSTLPLLVVAL